MQTQATNLNNRKNAALPPKQAGNLPGNSLTHAHHTTPLE